METGLLNFEAILNRTIQDFSDFTAYQKIKITYFKEGEWIFKMNKNLADMLVLNLIKNAVVHNQKDGEIVIRSTSTFFTVENTSDLPEISTNILFKRFNKNSNNKNSTGLGLSIVKTIADTSNLTISYSYNDGHHAFKVSPKIK